MSEITLNLTSHIAWWFRPAMNGVVMVSRIHAAVARLTGSRVSPWLYVRVLAALSDRAVTVSVERR